MYTYVQGAGFHFACSWSCMNNVMLFSVHNVKCTCIRLGPASKLHNMCTSDQLKRNIFLGLIILEWYATDNLPREYFSC